MDNTHIWKKVQNYKISIRKQLIQNQQILKRQQFINQIKENIRKQYQQPQNIINTNYLLIGQSDNEVIQQLHLILKSSSDIINDIKISSWIDTIAKNNNDIHVTNLIYQIVLKYILDGKRYLQTQLSYNILPIISHPQYIKLWEWVSMTGDYDVKRTALNYFQTLLNDISLTKQSITIITRVSCQFIMNEPLPQTRNIYFMTPFLTKILNHHKLTTQEYVESMNIIHFIIQKPQDLLITLGKMIPEYTEIKQISASLTLLTQIFFHSAELCHQICNLMGDVIGIARRFLGSTKKKEVLIPSLTALSNIVCNQSQYVVAFFERKDSFILNTLYFTTNHKEVKNQIIEFLYICTQILDNDDFGGVVLKNASVFIDILCTHLRQQFPDNIQKCVSAVLNIISYLLRTQQSYSYFVILINNDIIKSAERLLTHKSIEININAQKILDFMNNALQQQN